MAVVVYRGWGPEVFFEPVPKGSARLPYVFFCTVDVWAFESIYDSTLLKFAISVLGGHEKGFFLVLVPLKCTWIPKLLHVLLNLCPSPWM